MNKYEAQEIFDGAILSDAGIYVQEGNPHFSIGLSGEIDHFDWLYHIKDALTTLGFGVTDTYPKIYNSISHGKPYAQQLLRSSNTEMLWYHRNRWYPNGVKILPNDISLTPRTIANWFMGDGSNSWRHTNNTNITISTQSFTIDEVDRLVELLHAQGFLDAYRYIESNNLPIILLGTIDGNNHFISTIASYICESYNYKLKYAVRNNESNIESYNSSRALNRAQWMLKRKLRKLQ